MLWIYMHARDLGPNSGSVKAADQPDFQTSKLSIWKLDIGPKAQDS